MELLGMLTGMRFWFQIETRTLLVMMGMRGRGMERVVMDMVISEVIVRRTVPMLRVSVERRRRVLLLLLMELKLRILVWVGAGMVMRLNMAIVTVPTRCGLLTHGIIMWEMSVLLWSRSWTGIGIELIELLVVLGRKVRGGTELNWTRVEVLVEGVGVGVVGEGRWGGGEVGRRVLRNFSF